MHVCHNQSWSALAAGFRLLGHAVSKEFVDETTGKLAYFSGRVTEYDPVYNWYVKACLPCASFQKTAPSSRDLRFGIQAMDNT